LPRGFAKAPAADDASHGSDGRSRGLETRFGSHRASMTLRPAKSLQGRSPSVLRTRPLYSCDFLCESAAAPAKFASARGGFVTNPIPSTDSVFLKRFAMLIGFLVVVAVLLGALAAHIYSANPPAQNPDKAKILDQRIAPVGGVYAGNTGRAAMQAAQEAASKAAASQVAYGGTTDGKVIFGSLCHSCHETGVAGAPKVGDKAEWAPRIAEGIATLIKHATEGYAGKTGVMPAKGGNPALNDAQIKATVEWMVAQAK
jgi:cytochrome c5